MTIEKFEKINEYRVAEKPVEPLAGSSVLETGIWGAYQNVLINMAEIIVVRAARKR